MLQIHCAALLFARRVTGAPPTLEGAYDQITAPRFPAHIDELVIWSRLIYSADEAGAHNVSLVIWDVQSAGELGSSNGLVTLSERPERRHPSNDLTFNVTNVDIPHAGEYEFRLSVDSQLVGAVWLTVDSSM